MVDLLRYEHGIHAVDAGYLRPGLAAIHLIVENGRVAVVDTASNACLPRVLDALQTLELTPASVDYVVLTHVHLDHAGGAGAMMAAFPNARLVVHPRGLRHMADPTKLFAAVQAVYGVEEAHRMYGELVPVPIERILSADDGFQFELAGRTLTCLDTPGHARHHLSLLDSRSGCLFTGDIFGLSFRELDVDGRPSVIPTSTPTQFEPEVMHASVNRIVGHQPDALYLTHFSRVEDVPRLAGDLHRLIDAYVDLAERERHSGPERETRILAGLWALMEAEAERQGWRLPAEQWREVLRLDIELNAQGLDYWVGQDAARA
ncbi:MAG TPA: MBL fold metallo-hydrolase [Candidatus Competibacteraceae bacterium]|nr:MBL fold metallo-hydrolase [Candidatus Competibacteraceae bacterium]HQD54981.1 MBL fold metallo-hydrolase [Candidatus Competibacteraceae bacterium]